MDINTIIIYVIFALISLVLLLNFFKIFVNIFSRSKAKKAKAEELKPVIEEIRSQVNEDVRPHLTSLEGMYEKSASEKATLGAFVLSVFKDKFSGHLEKNPKIVEDEIDKCCSEYEGAECKESYCLEGAGISCPKT